MGRMRNLRRAGDLLCQIRSRRGGVGHDSSMMWSELLLLLSWSATLPLGTRSFPAGPAFFIDDLAVGIVPRASAGRRRHLPAVGALTATGSPRRLL